jgi:AcrR family transcriptional regulator
MTRKKLKEAALDIFSEKSADAATAEDITEKADLGKGTLHRHFADKEEVVLVLVEDAIEHLIERIRSYLEEHENMEDVLGHFFNAHHVLMFHFFKEYRSCIKCVVFPKIRSNPMNLRPPQFWNKSAQKGVLLICVKIICRLKPDGTTGNGKSKTGYVHLTN